MIVCHYVGVPRNVFFHNLLESFASYHLRMERAHLAARLGSRALQDTRCARGHRAGVVSAKVKEHKEEPSLERLVDMEVLQKERLDLGFLGESRGGEAHFLTETVYKSDHCDVNKILGKKWIP